MKVGDLVRRKYSVKDEFGTFIGFRVFDGKYECAEVMWFNRRASNRDAVSTIQKNLIEVVK